MRTYQVEQFEIIARPAFNRVLLPKVGPEFNVQTARVFVDRSGSLTIRDDDRELIFSDISEQSLSCVVQAGGVLVMNPDVTVHPKLIHIPLSTATY